MTVYTIDKRFETSVQRTPRVLEVAEAFGLGLSKKQFVVYDQVEVNIEPGQIVYIYGQSGSGKSILLRELSRLMADEGRSIADIAAIDLEDKPLVNQVGKTMTEAVNLLSKAGINDAYLLIRRPQELSDGQRYRLRLAKLIEQAADVWVADEFGAVLDRTTAKVVAFNMQRVARKLGKTLIVATTHTDLIEELGPDVMVHKTYHDRVEIETRETPHENAA